MSSVVEWLKRVQIGGITPVKDPLIEAIVEIERLEGGLGASQRATQLWYKDATHYREALERFEPWMVKIVGNGLYQTLKEETDDFLPERFWLPEETAPGGRIVNEDALFDEIAAAIQAATEALEEG